MVAREGFWVWGFVRSFPGTTALHKRCEWIDSWRRWARARALVRRKATKGAFRNSTETEGPFSAQKTLKSKEEDLHYRQYFHELLKFACGITLQEWTPAPQFRETCKVFHDRLANVNAVRVSKRKDVYRKTEIKCLSFLQTRYCTLSDATLEELSFIVFFIKPHWVRDLFCAVC